MKKFLLASAVILVSMSALAQDQTVKQTTAIQIMYRQMSDAYAVGRQALDACAADNAVTEQKLAAALKEIEELKKKLEPK